MKERFYLLQTIDPCNPSSEKVTIKFPVALIERWKQKEFVKFCNLTTAKKVFDNPKRIFYGTRAESQGWWCYVGKPNEWYVAEDVIATFPAQKVFAVLLNAEFEVYTYRAEEAADDDLLSPINWQERYERLVWKSLD